MINFIPIFPLNIVAYPGEVINLHIFEERYKQLINECVQQKKNFGIATILNDEIKETGTLMHISKIVKTYDGGRMDIIVKGMGIYSLLEIIKSVPDKLYSGAIVNYPQNVDTINVLMMQKIISGIRELHRLLNISKDFNKTDDQLMSYDVAHHAGLSLEEEYELLELLHEDQRLEYLKRHLNKVIPLIAGTEALKEKIKLNGHFKELIGLNLNDE